MVALPLDKSEAVLCVSRRQMLEVFGTGDRRALGQWLAAQRVEGPGVSMSLAELISSATANLERLDAPELGARIADLEAQILALRVRDTDDPFEDASSETLGDVLRTRDTTGLLFVPYPWYVGYLQKTGAAPPLVDYTLPLEHRRYKKSDERCTINPGRIGPNFVHTWALDLENVAGFRIPRGKPNDVAIYDSTWAGKDKLTVIDSCGQVLQTFTQWDFYSTAKYVDLQNRPPCAYDAKHAPYTRIYLILETSRDPSPGAPRWFRIEELEHITPLTGNEHAYVVADEVNYDYFDASIVPPNNEDFADALDADGKPFTRLYPPWAGGPQGANSKLAPEFKTQPDPARGWYLLGLNTTYAAQKYYTAVYYNERQAVLRIYLYNLDESTEYTAHVVKVHLEGCVRLKREETKNPEVPPKYLPEWQPLIGAFFPVDPNPKNWWQAEFVVGGWGPHTWTAVDIPVLYPMGGNLPAVGNHAVGWGDTSGVGAIDLSCSQPARTVGRYRSLYEDEFAPHQKNVRLVVSVRTFHQGYADLALVADAVGDAIQQSKPGALSKLFDAIKTGKDWYGYANDFGKLLMTGLDDRIKTSMGAAKTAAETLKKQMETSFTIIGAITATAGAMLKLFGVLPDDVLTLAITLSIQGKIGGTFTIQDIERETRYYLPGRFSMADALAIDGISGDEIRVSIDSCLPRYDRTLGLLGYAYQPWDVEVTVNANLRVGQAIIHTSDYAGPIHTEDDFFFPARHLVASIPSTRGNWPFVQYEERLLPDLLPVIVNPYAEIDVIPAQSSTTYEYVTGSYRYVDGLPYTQKFTVRSSQIYLTAQDRANWRYWWTAWQWIGGVNFGKYERRSEGEAGLPPPIVGPQPLPDPNLPPLRVNVMSVKLPTPETSIVPLKPRSFEDRRGLHVETEHQATILASSYGVKYIKSGVESFDVTAPAPMLLTDVIYCWKLTYLYWGDTRVPRGQAYPKVEETTLSSPVTIRCPPEDPPDWPPSSDMIAFWSWLFGAEAAKAWVDVLRELTAGGRFESSLLTQPSGIPELASVEVSPDPVPAGSTFDVTVRLTMPNPAATPLVVTLMAYPAVAGLPAELEVPGGTNTTTGYGVSAPAKGLYAIVATADATVRTATLHVA